MTLGLPQGGQKAAGGEYASSKDQQPKTLSNLTNECSQEARPQSPNICFLCSGSPVLDDGVFLIPGTFSFEQKSASSSISFEQNLCQLCPKPLLPLLGIWAFKWGQFPSLMFITPLIWEVKAKPNQTRQNKTKQNKTCETRGFSFSHYITSEALDWGPKYLLSLL